MAHRRFGLTVCADDFALSPGVSEGILKALEARRLTATSAMTTQPSWPASARMLRGLAPAADIGLHLNLTLGRPLTSMPRFAPEGTFPRVGQIIAFARRKALQEAEIRREIAAQLDAFEAHYGQAPDFVDGHQHVQILPGIRNWLIATLKERGLAGRIWLRDSGDRFSAILARRRELKKAAAVTWLSRGFAPEARAQGFVTNEGFAGFSNFDAASDYAAAFESYLKAPGPTHLVMCHPGYVDAELTSLDPVTATRPKELAFLLSDRFEDMLHRNGAKLTRLTRG